MIVWDQCLSAFLFALLSWEHIRNLKLFCYHWFTVCEYDLVWFENSMEKQEKVSGGHSTDIYIMRKYINKMSRWLSLQLFTASRWKGGILTPHQRLLQKSEAHWSLGSESSWCQLKWVTSSPPGPILSEATHPPHQACTLLPPNQDCLSTVRVGTGQWQCVHLRAHKYALMTNWQDGLVHKRTQRKGYKSLMKYCSEVCVFFSWIVSELSPFQPHSWPTPRWDGSSGGSSTQAVLCPSVCLFHPHLAVLDQKLRTTPKGEVRSGGEFFISDKGSRGRDTVIYSLLAFRYCLGLALCSTHLLPLCNPGSANTLFSWFWPAKRIFQEQAAARGGRDAKMIFKHWGNSYSSFRYQLKLCFSSYNRLNL